MREGREREMEREIRKGRRKQIKQRGGKEGKAEKKEWGKESKMDVIKNVNGGENETGGERWENK